MSAKQAAELAYAIRPRVVAKYVGQLCLVLAALSVIPLLASLWFGSGGFALRCALVMGVLVAGGGWLARLPGAARIQTNEALVIVGLIFVLAPFAMAFPMTASGLPFLDMFFEALSAVTTTGLTTTSGAEDKVAVILFLRAWMQWYGGLGFVVLSLALVMRPGLAARQLSGRPVEEEDVVGSTRVHARIVLAIYCILTAVGIVLLLGAGQRLFSAVIHTLTAVSTGGFSERDQLLVRLGGWHVQALIIVICLSGAMSLSMYHRAFRKGWREVPQDVQVRGLITTGSAAVVLLGLILHYVDRFGWGEVLHHAPILAFSAQTTAGFSSTDIGPLSAAAKLVLMLAMFIGAGVGSTGGGIKILRFLILLRLLQVMVRRVCLPRHAVLEPWLADRRLEDNEIQEALLVIFLFIGVIVLSWLPFLAYGYDPINSLFEVVSATGTVGLSTGVSNPHLAPLLKGVLCLDMLIGRLEVVAVLVLVYPNTWVGRRSELL
jgi:trk system potassium uptake protein TrkH